MEGTAGKGVGTEGRVMVAAVGLIGVAGRLWLWYHLKTAVCKLCGFQTGGTEWNEGGGYEVREMGERRERVNALMLPNLAGFELAPTTAKAGYEKKVFAAASVADMLACLVIRVG